MIETHQAGKNLSDPTSLFAAGQSYVALSRVRSLDGIPIEELGCSKLTGNTPRNSESLNEMMRLRNDSKVNFAQTFALGSEQTPAPKYHRPEAH
ncbi:hypothetical protein J6590_066195 [Homalodisca vitripennis]|nr:hypothetical protein J6590_066195 [Homalodisca vitripennis]